MRENKQKNTHHGHAVKRFRQTLGIKQDALAVDMGISQAMISNYESKKIIDDNIIEKFAKVLGIAPQLIKDLEEDTVTVIIENNTFEKGSVGNVMGDNNNYHPLEQMADIIEEKAKLYERIIQLEKEKSALLEKMLKEITEKK